MAVDSGSPTGEDSRWLINFWASWCGPAARGSALIRAQEALAATGFTVVVNIEESTSVALRLHRRFGVEYAIPMDFDAHLPRLRRRRTSMAPAIVFIIRRRDRSHLGRKAPDRLW